MFFFFKQKTAYEIKECDWSSDVCSSDLVTNKKIGHLIKIVGELKITEVREDMSIASIIQSYDVITRGDKLIEYKEIEVPRVDPMEIGRASCRERV